MDRLLWVGLFFKKARRVTMGRGGILKVSRIRIELEIPMCCFSTVPVWGLTCGLIDVGGW